MIDLSRRAALAGLFAACTTGGAKAADWPDKTITMVVPYPAGGGSDTFARPVAAAMADRFKQSIVVDNKSGAGGTVGTASASRAPADGYTLLLGDTGLTYAPLIYRNADFDLAATSRRSAPWLACHMCWWSTRPSSTCRRWPPS